ncbi:MAG TPA: SMC-Scp complex subunit ScpB [Rhodospirillaceae bacterium]|nr:SMC-Scp complex subunit ScpB [Rhodospirillaceae bacterium]MAX61256.1 SMC-Scp complex subunit ScpB [Rhodospirillaceae bacterium]MBB55999.1 SMC-Scp complex subunit ScpB [Rhodospirillaceae bacterium]HAE03460.1 SMC-Scp complex subunit ScpB [Rhodospirillaceae bacterium]HBM13401.1 SMC-Scp complex subunit ScpB [Rhodospirillaceae bacterium]|tara:strand:- start:129 stop:800 length:672 start_codon:yes stop_codon:yes gene_type:complete
MDRFQQLRLLEAMLFAAAEPVQDAALLERLPEGVDLASLLEELEGMYSARGVTLVKVGKGWCFRTASDLASHMTVEREVPRKLSRAAIETLAIIAYHQPVTRAEVEEVRGVALSKGSMDALLEAAWIRPRGRRRAPGKPVTWGTTERFLADFGLESLDDLPGVEELKAAGLLDSRPNLGAIAMQGTDTDDDARDEEDDERTAFLENDEAFDAVEEDEHIALDD